MNAHDLTAYDMAVILGACERQYRHDPKVLVLVREIVRDKIIDIEKGNRA